MDFNDLPLKDIEQDKLNFKNQAINISTFINEFPNTMPYAISIRGGWGVGKSTMINFIRTFLDKEKCEIINFNPWMINGRDELIFSLFEEINYCIDGEKHTKFKRKFSQYAQKLSAPITKTLTYAGAMNLGADPQTANVVSSGASETVNILAEDIFSKPLSKRKEEIDKDLKTMFKEDKKIVVLIDEVDRLFPNEIISLFKMIKSTLNFSGLFFVVAMDSDAVNDALIKSGITKPKKYLDKIFQRNYYINSKLQLKTLTKEFLSKRLKGKNEPCFNDLKYLINTFFYQKKENYLSSTTNNNSNKLYYKFYTFLRREFEVPRLFINFSNVLMKKWPNYYKLVFDKEEKNKMKLQVIFLIYILYFKYPNSEPNLVSKTISKNEDIPDLIKNINIFIKNICPKEKRKINGKEFMTTNSIVKTAIYSINRYPDIINSNN